MKINVDIYYYKLLKFNLILCSTYLMKKRILNNRKKIINENIFK